MYTYINLKMTKKKEIVLVVQQCRCRSWTCRWRSSTERHSTTSCQTDWPRNTPDYTTHQSTLDTGTHIYINTYPLATQSMSLVNTKRPLSICFSSKNTSPRPSSHSALYSTCGSSGDCVWCANSLTSNVVGRTPNTCTLSIWPVKFIANRNVPLTVPNSEFSWFEASAIHLYYKIEDFFFKKIFFCWHYHTNHHMEQVDVWRLFCIHLYTSNHATTKSNNEFKTNILVTKKKNKTQLVYHERARR